MGPASPSPRRFERRGRRPLHIEAARVCSTQTVTSFADGASVLQRVEIWARADGGCFGVVQARRDGGESAPALNDFFDCADHGEIRAFTASYDPACLTPAFDVAVAEGPSVSAETLDLLVQQSNELKNNFLTSINKLICLK